MEYNSDFRYDLKFGIVSGETWFHNIVSNSTFEVKSDRASWDTGNIYIEYQSRGLPSGIRTTCADYWVYKTSEKQAIVIETDELKRKINILVRLGKAKMGVPGGDDNTSLGFLVRIKDLILDF
jgi:hypothetical protein